MINLVDLGMEMQKRVIEAHEQSIAAARKVMDRTDASAAVQQAVVDASAVVQQAVVDAAGANLALWDKWLALWGLRK